MMETKSFVTLSQEVCVVCGRPFDTGDLLIDKRLRPKFDMHTVIGWGLCDEHEQMFKDGYIALVAVDEAQSVKQPNGSIRPADAYRTGAIAHLRGEAWEKVFNTPLPLDSTGTMRPAVFVDPKIVDLLAERAGVAKPDADAKG